VSAASDEAFRQSGLRTAAIEMAKELTPLIQAKEWVDAERTRILHGPPRPLEMNYRLQVVLAWRIHTLKMQLADVLEQIDPEMAR
jgi:hypothetical protein